MSNLSYVFNLAIKNNVPIYLKPAEYLDFEQHNFLLLQLYYLYCKFKNSKPAFSRRADPPPQLVFKDEGRILGKISELYIFSDRGQQSDVGRDVLEPGRSSAKLPADRDAAVEQQQQRD